MFESMTHYNIKGGAYLRELLGGEDNVNACAFVVIFLALVGAVCLAWCYRDVLCDNKRDLMSRLWGQERMTPLEAALQSNKRKEHARGGNFQARPQNRCNETTDGKSNANDWMCRNDGFSGYNVAGTGEHFGQKKGL